MLTLFYSPGACSMASHIGLEESGTAYELKPVALAKGEQRTPDYLKINPRGRVPALRLEDGSVLTENTAILSYLGLRFPEKGLLPKESTAQARCISMMAWLSNSVHPAFTHIFRPERFSEQEAAYPSIKAAGKKTFWAALQEIDGMVAGKSWMQGDQFTACDPYALVFYGWGARIELPVKELANYTAWKRRMLERPAVRKVLEREQNILLKAA
ncbi:MAG TPA: glutathione S-transferase N-terminal domain-containing protein [Stellaceae bacterium]|nr:glutathione S-transferase N-terminal domain-containing protein [Stellaceae bacterium]